MIILRMDALDGFHSISSRYSIIVPRIVGGVSPGMSETDRTKYCQSLSLLSDVFCHKIV